MLTLICLFCPAVITVRVYEYLAGVKLGLKQCVLQYATDVLLINLGCVAAKTLILGTGALPLQEGGDMLPSAAFIYMVMAIVCALLLGVGSVLLGKKVKFEVEDEHYAH